MDKTTITQYHAQFEDVAQEENGVEYWMARDLQLLLGYSEWRNFLAAIEKAKIACLNSGHNVSDHFVGVNKMIDIGKGAKREVEDIILNRYACYLIAQNGDPRKNEIAFAQTYFALQTRKQELIEERLHLRDRLQARQKLTESETELSKNIYERGVDEQGFGRIRSRGDAALFGGHTTAQMKKKLDMPPNRPLADFLPTVTLAAKNLAAEITNHNVKQHDLHGEPLIVQEHIQNNTSVRNMLVDRGIKPEELPPEEDIKKLERRVAAGDKKALKDIKKLSGNGDRK
ncbi:DNA damage-inducible protein D [bacterium]|nr:DNA damage-inducible protein D [bacterium]